MSGQGAAEDADLRSVRTAALRTAWQVALVSTGLVVGILGLAVLFILHQSLPSELLEPARPGQPKIYVDSREVVVALVVLGAIAIVVVGLASWGISRRAVAPIAAALRMQRAFVADASHELRTPLAVLDTRLQVLDRRLARGEAYEETLEAARRDTGVMIDLVTDLLLVAESAATGAEEGCDLRPVLLASASDLQLLAAQRDVTIAVSIENEARVGLSEPSLRRALVVLVDNAVAHSPAGATVDVHARVEKGRAIVRVRDAGPGITGIEPDRVFERFARGEPAGHRRGFGIGLALVRDLAVRHGGHVEVESTSAAGTLLRLELPVAR